MTKKTPQKGGGTHADRIKNERGSRRHPLHEGNLLTPDEMLDALRDEVIAISRAAEMQIRELTVIATDYARGRLTPEEATERYYRHSDRWADPMYGLPSRAFEGSDESILRALKKERTDYKNMVQEIRAGAREHEKGTGLKR